MSQAAASAQDTARVFGHPRLHVDDGAAVSADVEVSPDPTTTADAAHPVAHLPAVAPTAPATLRLPLTPVSGASSCGAAHVDVRNRLQEEAAS